MREKPMNETELNRLANDFGRLAKRLEDEGNNELARQASAQITRYQCAAATVSAIDCMNRDLRLILDRMERNARYA